MRVGILTQYYPPEVGAPQGRLASLARRLQERGHHVTVLTAMPNYPTGRTYPGYGGLFRDEQLNGVRVLRAWIYPAKRRSVRHRLANYFSFVATSLVVGAAKLPHLDYLLTESPPLFLGITGVILSRLKKARWILNVSDLWPDSVQSLGVMRSTVLLGAARKLELFLYRHAWMVTGQTKGIVRAVRDRAPEVVAYHFPNGVDMTMFDEATRAVGREQDGTCRFVYAGLHGIAQGLDVVLDAVDRIGSRDDLLFEFVGDGPEKGDLRAQAERARLKNVQFLDPVPHELVPALVASADVAIVPLKLPIAEAVPSKLYEAMAAGTAVLLIADAEAVGIVEEARAGVAVRPGDAEAVAQAILRLAADRVEREEMGARGRAYATRFDRYRINDRLIEHLESELAPR